ncbi:MAG: ABC transporter permease, partial [Alphaproteobacteria bacterium]
MRDLSLAFTFARRELRGGLRGFAVFIACLFLGVAAIAGVGSMSASIQAAIRADARVLLGGDIALRLTHRTAAPEQLAWLRAAATATAGAEMRAMAADAAGGPRTLVELKAVDGAYPLYGEMRLAPDMGLARALAPRAGVHGAVAEPALAERLGLKPGDRLRIGDAEFELRALIAREPDRGISALTLGPRVMIADAALADTGLIQPGSLVRFRYRLRLPNGADLGAFAAAMTRAFPDAGWRVRRADISAPGLGPVLRQLTLFLTLIGLTALLVGGIGVSNAVRAHLDGRARTIAILKCLGAPGGLVSRVYLIQILLIAGVAILAGLIAGALAPLAGAGLIAELLPVRLRAGLHWEPLLLAAAFGLLTTVAFTLWPLGRARETSAAGLFRNAVTPGSGRPRGVYFAGAVACTLALAGLAVATAENRPMALWFVGGTAATLSAFALAARGLRAVARRAARPAVAGRVPGLRLALANIARPGAPTGSIVVSVGAGLAVLVALALIEGNLSRQIAERMPARAPSFFFINILPDQVAPLARTVDAAASGATLEGVPSLRGRITHINGVPVARAAVASEARWALDSDRGLTYAARPPAGTELAAGRWWPPDYAGPPLISFAAGLAHGMGIGVGDSITLNILGREVEARIANLRAVDWRSLG